jgi:hypothetical protein
MKVCSSADVSEEHTVPSSGLMLEAFCSSEMLATQPTSMWFQHPKAVSTSMEYNFLFDGYLI